jgi:hypothetical protein
MAEPIDDRPGRLLSAAHQVSDSDFRGRWLTAVPRPIKLWHRSRSRSCPTSLQIRSSEDVDAEHARLVEFESVPRRSSARASQPLKPKTAAVDSDRELGKRKTLAKSLIGRPGETDSLVTAHTATS